MHLDVLVIGRNCLDTVAAIERYPEEDKKVPLAFRLKEGGGQGGTAACCIARLGGKAAFVGKVGGDTEGAFCCQRLDDFGVDATYVERVPSGRTPVAYIFVTRGSGKRTIIYEHNALPKLTMEDIRPALNRRPRALLLDPEVTYLAETLRAETDRTAKIVYDCERWRSGMEAMMAAADFFIPSSDFLDDPHLALPPVSFAGKLRILKERINGELIVTRGEWGAYYFADERLFHLPAPPVAVQDTTGAGDNFHAAFALAQAEGSDIHTAVRFAVAVASLSCREYGGRAGIPERRQADSLAATLVASPANGSS